MKQSINRTIMPIVYMTIQDMLDPDINQNITHPWFHASTIDFLELSSVYTKFHTFILTLNTSSLFINGGLLSLC